jgi:hypothetical protein
LLGIRAKIPRQFLARIVHKLDWRIEMKTMQKTRISQALDDAIKTASIVSENENKTSSPFNLASYAVTKDLTLETVTEFAIHVAKNAQSTSAQIRVWVYPDLDPESPQTRAMAGESLDNGLSRVCHLLCQVRVGHDSLAVATGFDSYQSILRNAFPILKQDGGNVSVRTKDVKPNKEGGFDQTKISPTSAFIGAPYAEWSRIDSETGILRIARISWKQGVKADILDSIRTVNATPGGENIGPANDAGKNDAILPDSGKTNEFSRVAVAYTPQAVGELLHRKVDPLQSWMLGNIRHAKLADADLFLSMVPGYKGAGPSLAKMAKLG